MIFEIEKENFKSIYNILDDEIIPRAKKEKLDRFEFSGESKKWCPKLEEIFAERKLNKSKQLIYKLKYDQWKDHKKRRLNDKFRLKEIDAELLNDKNIGNLNYITSEILRWWDSCDKYLEKTFGYCIIFNNKIVSYCICNFVYDNIHTIGIETLKDYRRKSLSQAAAEAFIEKCTSEKLDPHWECMESNIASRNLAEKLKFKLERVYRLYSFPI